MKLKEKKLAVFDLDGTLIHYEFDIFFEQSMSILPQLKYGHITREELHHFFTLYDFFGFVPQEERESFEEGFWSMWTHEHHLPLRPFEDTAQVLDELLTQDKKIAIATARNALPDAISEKLQRAGLLRYIHQVSTKHACALPWWNKTAQLEAVCKEMGVSPSDSFMVGDTPPDISSAKLVGFGNTIALLSGGIRREVLEKEDPDKILEGIGELLGILKD